MPHVYSHTWRRGSVRDAEALSRYNRMIEDLERNKPEMTGEEVRDSYDRATEKSLEWLDSSNVKEFCGRQFLFAVDRVVWRAWFPARDIEEFTYARPTPKANGSKDPCPELENFLQNQMFAAMRLDSTIGAGQKGTTTAPLPKEDLEKTEHVRLSLWDELGVQEAMQEAGIEIFETWTVFLGHRMWNRTDHMNSKSAEPLKTILLGAEKAPITLCPWEQDSVLRLHARPATEYEGCLNLKLTIALKPHADSRSAANKAALLRGWHQLLSWHSGLLAGRLESFYVCTSGVGESGWETSCAILNSGCLSQLELGETVTKPFHRENSRGMLLRQKPFSNLTRGLDVDI